MYLINKNLSELTRAESYSHEANGHVCMYLTTHDKIKPNHKYVGTTDVNFPLKNMIIKSKMETISNMSKK